MEGSDVVENAYQIRHAAIASISSIKPNVSGDILCEAFSIDLVEINEFSLAIFIFMYFIFSACLVGSEMCIRDRNHLTRRTTPFLLEGVSRFSEGSIIRMPL